MRTIAITEFKAHCLEIIASLTKNGEEIQITKRGKPVARILPPANETGVKYSIGAFANTTQIVGDVVNIDFSDEWEALK